MKLDISYSSEGVVNDATVHSICTNLPQLEHLDLSGNPGISDIGALGVQPDNLIASSIIGLKELIAKDGKVMLGSKYAFHVLVQCKIIKEFLGMKLILCLMQGDTSLQQKLSARPKIWR